MDATSPFPLATQKCKILTVSGSCAFARWFFPILSVARLRKPSSCAFTLLCEQASRQARSFRVDHAGAQEGPPAGAPLEAGRITQTETGTYTLTGDSESYHGTSTVGSQRESKIKGASSTRKIIAVRSLLGDAAAPSLLLLSELFSGHIVSIEAASPFPTRRRTQVDARSK